MANQSVGQEKAIQATKKIEKKYSSNHVKELNIFGEKADINILPSEDNFYHISIRFISQHSDALIAQEQLSYMKHLISNKGKSIVLRNYLLVEQGKKVEGTIKTIYSLKIPNNTKTKISNSLGNIVINNISGEFNLETKYGNIILENITGEIKSLTNMGDVYLSNCNAICNLDLNYTNAYFRNNGGRFTLNTNMGSCNFSLNKKVSFLKIEASGTNITLNNKSCLYFGYYLETELGKISIDDCCIPVKTNIKLDERFQNKKQTRFEYRKTTEPTNVIIYNKYNNITIL